VPTKSGSQVQIREGSPNGTRNLTMDERICEIAEFLIWSERSVAQSIYAAEQTTLIQNGTIRLHLYESVKWICFPDVALLSCTCI